MNKIILLLIFLNSIAHSGDLDSEIEWMKQLHYFELQLKSNSTQNVIVHLIPTLHYRENIVDYPKEYKQAYNKTNLFYREVGEKDVGNATYNHFTKLGWEKSTLQMVKKVFADYPDFAAQEINKKNNTIKEFINCEQDHPVFKDKRLRPSIFLARFEEYISAKNNPNQNINLRQFGDEAQLKKYLPKNIIINGIEKRADLFKASGKLYKYTNYKIRESILKFSKSQKKEIVNPVAIKDEKFPIEKWEKKRFNLKVLNRDINFANQLIDVIQKEQKSIDKINKKEKVKNTDVTHITVEIGGFHVRKVLEHLKKDVKILTKKDFPIIYKNNDEKKSTVQNQDKDQDKNKIVKIDPPSGPGGTNAGLESHLNTEVLSPMSQFRREDLGGVMISLELLEIPTTELEKKELDLIGDKVKSLFSKENK